MGVYYLRKTRKTPKGKLVPLVGGVYVSRGVAYTLVFFLWWLGVLFIAAPIIIVLHQTQAVRNTLSLPSFLFGASAR